MDDTFNSHMMQHTGCKILYNIEDIFPADLTSDAQAISFQKILHKANSPQVRERRHKRNTRLQTYDESTAVQERLHLRASAKMKNSLEDKKDEKR